MRYIIEALYLLHETGVWIHNMSLFTHVHESPTALYFLPTLDHITLAFKICWLHLPLDHFLHVRVCSSHKTSYLLEYEFYRHSYPLRLKPLL